jgi:2'-5' RNA ligase
MTVRGQTGASPAGCGSARLFVALWPDDPVRRALGAWVVPGSGAGTKPVAGERLHLTLHFMANVPNDCLPALRAALQLPFQPFELHFSRRECWPGGLLVAPPDAWPPAPAGLHAHLGDRLRGLGVPVEARRYRGTRALARRQLCAGMVPGATGRWLRGAALLPLAGATRQAAGPVAGDLTTLNPGLMHGP